MLDELRKDLAHEYTAVNEIKRGGTTQQCVDVRITILKEKAVYWEKAL